MQSCAIEITEKLIFSMDNTTDCNEWAAILVFKIAEVQFTFKPFLFSDQHYQAKILNSRKQNQN